MDNTKDYNKITTDLTTILKINPKDIIISQPSPQEYNITPSKTAKETFQYNIKYKQQIPTSIQKQWEQHSANTQNTGLKPLLILQSSKEEPLTIMRWSDLVTLLKQHNQYSYMLKGYHDIDKYYIDNEEEQ